MLSYFILGLALLAALLLAVRWFATADPKTLAKTLKWVGFALVAALILFLAVSGRLGWALMALPALLPWFLRARSMARTAKAFSRMAAGAAGQGTGQTSAVETRFLDMILDHDSGAMTGTVREGPYAGRRLDDMSLAELAELLRTCWIEDAESAQVLEAYLDRVHGGDWRAQAEQSDEGGGFAAGRMSPEEARRILGVEPGASPEDIKKAHRRLMAGTHPDRGGSDYLAAKINEAKDVLLGE